MELISMFDTIIIIFLVIILTLMIYNWTSVKENCSYCGSKCGENCPYKKPSCNTCPQKQTCDQKPICSQKQTCDQKPKCPQQETYNKCSTS